MGHAPGPWSGRAGAHLAELLLARRPVRQPILAERGEIDREVDAVPQEAGETRCRLSEHAFPKVRAAADGTVRVTGRDHERHGGSSDATRTAGTLRATMPEPFRHVLRVRYGECDPQGVVFNANYFTYFDVALTELWRESVGPYTDMMAAGVDMVVAEASARYLAPAGFDEELAIDVAVVRLGTTSMVTRIEVTSDSALVVEGEMRHVFIDAETKRKTEIPPEIRRGLERHLVAEAGAWSTSG